MPRNELYELYRDASEGLGEMALSGANPYFRPSQKDMTEQLTRTREELEPEFHGNRTLGMRTRDWWETTEGAEKRSEAFQQAAGLIGPPGAKGVELGAVAGQILVKDLAKRAALRGFIKEALAGGRKAAKEGVEWLEGRARAKIADPDLAYERDKALLDRVIDDLGAGPWFHGRHLKGLKAGDTFEKHRFRRWPAGEAGSLSLSRDPKVSLYAFKETPIDRFGYEKVGKLKSALYRGEDKLQEARLEGKIDFTQYHTGKGAIERKLESFGEAEAARVFVDFEGTAPHEKVLPMWMGPGTQKANQLFADIYRKAGHELLKKHPVKFDPTSQGYSLVRHFEQYSKEFNKIITEELKAKGYSAYLRVPGHYAGTGNKGEFELTMLDPSKARIIDFRQAKDTSAATTSVLKHSRKVQDLKNKPVEQWWKESALGGGTHFSDMFKKLIDMKKDFPEAWAEGAPKAASGFQATGAPHWMAPIWPKPVEDTLSAEVAVASPGTPLGLGLTAYNKLLSKAKELFASNPEVAPHTMHKLWKENKITTLDYYAVFDDLKKSVPMKTPAPKLADLVEKSAIDIEEAIKGPGDNVVFAAGAKTKPKGFLDWQKKALEEAEGVGMGLEDLDLEELPDPKKLFPTKFHREAKDIEKYVYGQKTINPDMLNAHAALMEWSKDENNMGIPMELFKKYKVNEKGIMQLHKMGTLTDYTADKWIKALQDDWWAKK